MTDKPFSEMTDAELRAEHAKWDAKVRGATRWGAALAAADSFRAQCERELGRRAIQAVRPSDEPERDTAT